MNSNVFSDALFLSQNSSLNDSYSESPFSTWGDADSLSSQNGFQSDGPLTQSIYPQNMFDNGESSIPPGLFAAIAAAISQYFQVNSSEKNMTSFRDVSLSSTGDPHDAINGTTSTGTMENRSWNDMQSRSNLLSAPKLAGGLRFSSSVGNPNGQGATMNSGITATAEQGHTTITFAADGKASVQQGNIVNTLVPNETLQLSQSLYVTDNGNSLTINAQNTDGGSLNATLSENSQGGIDVNAHGRNIALGGYLVNSLAK
jgi:hypothetical protein